jgi:hypothetical protein
MYTYIHTHVYTAMMDSVFITYPPPPHPPLRRHGNFSWNVEVHTYIHIHTYIHWFLALVWTRHTKTRPRPRPRPRLFSLLSSYAPHTFSSRVCAPCDWQHVGGEWCLVARALAFVATVSGHEDGGMMMRVGRECTFWAWLLVGMLRAAATAQPFAGRHLGYLVT